MNVNDEKFQYELLNMIKHAEHKTVSDAEFEQIQKVVNEPANPSDALRDLMTRERDYTMRR